MLKYFISLLFAAVTVTSFPNWLDADIVFTTGGNYEVGSESYSRGDLSAYTPVVGTSTLSFDRDLITGGNRNIDAAHWISASELLFTSGGGFTIGGIDFDRGDLVRYDVVSGAASLYFDRDLITGGNRDVTAAALNGNDLIFTTRGNFEIDGQSFERGDLVAYDLTTGSASLFFDRDLITAGSRNITSAHFSQGTLLFTTEGKSTIGGVEYQEGDVISRNLITEGTSLFLDREIITGGNQNIVALTFAVPEPSSLIVLVIGAGAASLIRRRRKLVPIGY